MLAQDDGHGKTLSKMERRILGSDSAVAIIVETGPKAFIGIATSGTALEGLVCRL